ncbi:crossover junction endodeoxyribonuclease RuvC [Bacillota bacterium Meth-B3]
MADLLPVGKKAWIEMTILGIDPGLATMGWGVIETAGDRHRLIQFGALTTAAGQPMPQRLRAIFLGVNQLMDMFSPDEVAFEELFFSKNVTTGMAVSAARGAALVAVAQRTENLYEYTPMQIKQAVTGHGKADKHQMQMMVKILLGMDEIARPDDAADALAVAVTHAHCMNARHLYKIK